MDSVKVVYSSTSLSYTSNLRLYNLVIIDYINSLNFHLGKQEQIKQKKLIRIKLEISEIENKTYQEN